MNLINEYFYEYNCLYHENVKTVLQKIDIRTLVYRDQTLKILTFIDQLFQNLPLEEKDSFFRNWNNAVELLNRMANGNADDYNEIAIERVREMIGYAVSIRIKYAPAPQHLLKISKRILSKKLFLYLLEKHDGNIPIGQLNFYNEEAKKFDCKCNIDVEEIYNSL